MDSVNEDCVKVRILQTSACAACKAAGFCNASESKEKLVDVYSFDGAVKKGDTVVVAASTNVVGRALLLGFGLPFAVLMSALFLMMYFTHAEGLSALSALASLIPYYLVLYLLRNRIKRKMVFEIET